MASRGAFQQSVRSLLRDRLLNAARDVVITSGWSRLRMAEIASQVGVSRQTVYNEFGNKTGLGEALALREAETFLSGIAERLEKHSDDLNGAIQSAVEFTLSEAAENPLLKAVLTATPGGAGQMLPFLTTRSEPILTAANEVLLGHLETYWPQLELTAQQRQILVESVVRLVVSHVMMQRVSAGEVARQVAWLVDRIAGVA
ncbi:TetR family transcriptional regulator [Haloechinothrix sp. LS1_15]|uniref:TetR family transcriptional regulator n=1 Tax=Haloechinothrix sp. LS1_15 TaxID=2652248 RepID=UPI0029460F57|nr:TetR family transcriptional regulator [Haloechinothrix sp. LS1_15]MDV6013745.1 TetR/AcrR family transcriptional regulator [Haloechinothrix sp. LS1_15]